jgi:phage terminase small subunit
VATLTRDEVVLALVGQGTARDKAVQYADAFEEYRVASANIAEHGVVVAHPRTGAPLENPYLKIRDKALQKLQSMRDVKAAFLWA